MQTITISMVTLFRFHVSGLTFWKPLQADEVFLGLFCIIWTITIYAIFQSTVISFTMLKITHFFKVGRSPFIKDYFIQWKPPQNYEKLHLKSSFSSQDI